MEADMTDVLVSVYKTGIDHDLLAVVPIAVDDLSRENGRRATDSELIEAAMVRLRDQGRFSDTEIDSFRYRVDRPESSDAPEPLPDAVFPSRPSDHLTSR